MQVKLNWTVNDGPVQSEVRSLGLLPIMVGSSKCNLEGKSPAELVSKHEDPEEFGGYFVSNGIERLIRLLIVPRRNYPIAIIRPSFTNRGPTFTTFGVQMRCVRNDQTSQTVTLHYCTDGAIHFRFSYRKSEYMVPVLLVLRALCQTSDRELFEKITMGDYENTFLTDRVEMLLRSFRRYSMYTRDECLTYLGSKFAVMLDSAENVTQREAGIEFLQKVVMVHLEDFKSKFDVLIFNIQKLYALVSGDYGADNPDSLQFQETLLPGHLYLSIIKEKMVDWLAAIKGQIYTEIRLGKSKVDFQDKKFISKVLQRTSNSSDIGKKMEYFLATGNLVSNTGLDLQQTSGYTIIAEKLNFYRYVAHYRSIHRGSFFAELKTTTVRKLLPESWGFLCPVHTPDGSPCGLLNHLTHTCKIINSKVDVSAIPSLVASLGAYQMIGSVPIYSKRAISSSSSAEDIISGRKEETVTIQLDGRVIGWASAQRAQTIAKILREWKIKGMHNVPLELEIGYVPPSNGGQYPGLYLFSSPARMIRAVRHLTTNQKDMVGPFEQVYMDIACMPEDIIPGVTTHQEYNPTDMLSVVASLTPFSDFNQSPRNMYQCQMGKQAMGTPTQNFPHRTDNKMYRLQTGQTPIVRPSAHDKYGLDNYPNGMNAVVCVISYTGYDMEDASIISKFSHERGYGYGTIYKGEWVDLGERRRKGEPITHYFGFFADGSDRPGLSPSAMDKAMQFLDLDGLPLVGNRIKQGDPLYAYVDDVSGQVTIVKYKGSEEAVIDQVRLLGT
jgi:DNA-directed RNA polymerase I subunit RPA2